MSQGKQRGSRSSSHLRGKAKRIDHKSQTYRDLRRLTFEREERIGKRFNRTLNKRKPVMVVAEDGRKLKVYLIPIRKRTSMLGDVLLIPERKVYYGFLEEIDDDAEGDTELFTLLFDCLDRDFVQKNLRAMLQPDFPFDRIANDAQSCAMEFTVSAGELELMRAAIRQQPNGRMQELVEKTWWEIYETNIPRQGAVLAIKYLPPLGNPDPTTIVSSCVEVTTSISDLRVPEMDWLRGLVAMSHAGELADGYGK